MNKKSTSTEASIKKYINQTEPVNLLYWLLCFVYFVGICGLCYPPTNEWFKSLTPLNLIITGAYLIFFQKWKQQAQWLAGIFIFLFGIALEAVGVATGFPFGSYEYGTVLGTKVFDTPILIGLNWILVVVGSLGLVQTLLKSSSSLLVSFLAALLMVGIDYLIEPIAVWLGFWTWAGNTIPMSNYLGWFMYAFPLCWLAFRFKLVTNVAAARNIFILQALFFLALNSFLNLSR